MRKTLFTIALGGLLTLGVTGIALAQDTPPPPPDQNQAGPPPDQGQQGPGMRRMDPDRQLQHMTRELGLSADQQSAIKPLLVDRDQKLQALFQDQSSDRRSNRQKARTISEDSRSKIEAVLTPDQKQKFESMQQNMRRRNGGPSGPPPPDGAAPPPQQ